MLCYVLRNAPLENKIMTFNVKRRGYFIMMSLVIPTYVLGWLTMVGTIIPTSSGEVFGFYMTLNLALVFILNQLSTIIVPPAFYQDLSEREPALFIFVIYS